MANRLTKIYTRTGDQGLTGLANGRRVSKAAPRMETIGQVDELNSVIGLLLCEDLPETVRKCLTGIQHDLFDLGGELSVPGHSVMTAAHTTSLERALDAFNEPLKPLKEFILPGGSRGAALAHLARTVCRRAERAMVALAASEAVPPELTAYLNRLSDLLFVMARVINRHAGLDDVYWQQRRNRAESGKQDDTTAP